MRYETVIVLLVFILIISVDQMRKRAQIKTAVRFCEKVTDLCVSYKKMQTAETENRTEEYEIDDMVYYRMVFDPKDPESYFFQMEFAFADVLGEAEKLKDKEFDFIEEDWEYIEEHSRRLEELIHNVHYESWLRGYRKA